MPRTSDARDRIVHTAARLFLERSYHAVGIDELCRTADVRKGSFYHYFPSKSDVAKAVIDLHARAFLRHLDIAPGASAAERLHAIPDAIGAVQSGFEAHYGRAVGCPFGNLAAELATSDEELRVHLANTLGTLEAALAAVCRDGVEDGVLRAGTDPDQLAHALFAQYQGMILLAKLNNAGVSGLAPALHDFVDGYLAEV